MANLSEAFDHDIEPDRDVRMVLRTVYLPPDVDDELRVRAFRSNQTKNDLIREAVTRWLSDAGADGSASGKGGKGTKVKGARGAARTRQTSSRKPAGGKK